MHSIEQLMHFELLSHDAPASKSPIDIVHNSVTSIAAVHQQQSADALRTGETLSVPSGRSIVDMIGGSRRGTKPYTSSDRSGRCR